MAARSYGGHESMRLLFTAAAAAAVAMVCDWRDVTDVSGIFQVHQPRGFCRRLVSFSYNTSMLGTYQI